MITSIIILIVSVAFTISGYLIFIKKKYNVINGYTNIVKIKKNPQAYAESVGKVEFFGGILNIVLWIACLIFADYLSAELIGWVLTGGLVVVLIGLLIVNIVNK